VTTEQQQRRDLMAWLVATARTGDGGAFGQLAALAGPRLLGHARRLCDDDETAADLVQDGWAQIVRGLRGLHDDRAFLPWALRIVTRLAARDVRGRMARRRLALGLAAEGQPVNQAQDETADVAVLRAAIARLSPAHAAALTLFYLDDMSVAEVAIALDIPSGTVKTRLMHARDNLRALLKGNENGQV